MAKSRDRKVQEVRDIIVDNLPTLCREAIALVQAKDMASSARAQLISTLFRAAGLFETDDDARQKEPHEMTAAELAVALADARARAEVLEQSKSHDEEEADEDDDIFA